MKYIYITCTILLINTFVSAQSYTSKLIPNIPAITNGVSIWGDYDLDGDYDLFVMGNNIAQLYQNNNGVFAITANKFIGLSSASAAWGDYDSDGDLDLIYSGYTSNYIPTTKLYQNNNNTFQEISNSITGFSGGSIQWGDYDTDGDLDLLIAGYKNDADSKYYTKIYNNNKTILEDSKLYFDGPNNGFAIWADINNDNYLDLFISGYQTCKLYQYSNGKYVDKKLNLSYTSEVEIAIGDYNSDNYVDLLTASSGKLKLYTNNNGEFNNTFTNIPSNLYENNIDWADADNDGDLDIITTNAGKFNIKFNNNSVFNRDTILNFSSYNKFEIIDFDKDKDIDYVYSPSSSTTHVLTSSPKQSNSSPNIPTNLQSNIQLNNAYLKWDKSKDSQSDTNNIKYNIYITKTGNNNYIKSPQANKLTGNLLMHTVSNVSNVNFFSIKNLSPGTYQWSVQAIDGAASSSVFATENIFTIIAPNIPIPKSPLHKSENQRLDITFTWVKDISIKNYDFQLSKDPSFETVLNSLTNIADTITIINNLEKNTTYYWRIRSRNNQDNISNWCNYQEFNTLYPFVAQNIILPPSNLYGLILGDYNNDGYLDALNNSSKPAFYKNNALAFSSDIVNTLQSDNRSTWVDLDNDGDLDVFGNTFVFENISGIFYSKSNGLFSNISNSSFNLVDLNEDGLIDVIQNGYLTYDNNPQTYVYMNDGKFKFTKKSHNFLALNNAKITSIDYDADGDKDLFFSGLNASNQYVEIAYQNNLGTYQKVTLGLPAIKLRDFEVADYNKDGYKDLLLANADSLFIYKNLNGKFTKILVPVTNLKGFSGVKWIDFDNDGDEDIAISGINPLYGKPENTSNTKILVNKNGIFSDTISGLHTATSSTIAIADINNDGDMDIIAYTPKYEYQFFENSININKPNKINSKPNAPISFSAIPSQKTTILSWQGGSDTETPTKTLSYNVVVGKEPKAYNILKPNGNTTTGFPLFVSEGNIGSDQKCLLNNLKPGKYFWKIQTIDQGFAYSTYSTEQNFTVIDSVAPTTIYPYDEQDSLTRETTFTWLPFSNATKYYIEISKDSTFATKNIVDSTSSLSYNTQKLILNSKFYWRVRAKINTSSYTAWSHIKRFSVLHNPNIVSQNITKLYYGDSKWADYDNDGDMDLLICGTKDSTSGKEQYMYELYRAQTKLYKNNNGILSEVPTTIIGLTQSSIDWGDFDNDGDLDIVIMGGLFEKDQVFTNIYRNDNGTFNLHNANLPGACRGEVKWVDFDNDGDLDLSYSGGNSISDGLLLTKLYSNTNGIFIETISNIVNNYRWSSQDWGDFDKDGDLDLAITGRDMANIYINSNGIFRKTAIKIFSTYRGAYKWGDFDNDGDLDLLSNGQQNSDAIYNGTDYKIPYGTTIYENIKDSLIAKLVINNSYSYSDAQWADYDNDGDLDIFLTGNNSNSFTDVFLNDQGTYKVINAGLRNLSFSKIALADTDNDGDLDIFVQGTDGSIHGPGVNRFYTNNARANQKPTAPQSVNSIVSGSKIIFYWSRGTDESCNPLGLNYNLRLGNTSNGNEIYSSNSTANGYYKVVKPGIAKDTMWYFTKLIPGQYYFNVQSIDPTYTASDFSKTHIATIYSTKRIATIEKQQLQWDNNVLRIKTIVSNDGGDAILEEGICYSTNPNPTISDMVLKNAALVSIYVTDLKNLAPNTTYYIRSYVKNSQGIAYSSEEVFKTPIISNIVDAFVHSQLSIIPNPNNGIFTFKLNDSNEHVEIIIYNANGNIVYKENVKNSNGTIEKLIDIRDMTKGIYYLKTITNKNVFFNKFCLE